MQAYIDILKIEEDNPELYKKASLSKYWNSWIQYGEILLLIDNERFLHPFLWGLNFLIKIQTLKKDFKKNDLLEIIYLVMIGLHEIGSMEPSIQYKMRIIKHS